jgi:iron complex outermembrane recepter protein
MKSILSAIFVLLSSFTFAQIRSDIRGTVKTSDGQPANNVHIRLKEANKATVADADGNYHFKNVATGFYTVVTSYIGLEPKEVTIEVKPNETTVVPEITLSENSTSLQEIIVTGERNKLGEKESNYVSRMPLKNLENPQAYSVVNAKIIEQQVLTNFDDALKSAAGVVSVGSEPGVRSYSYLRGFDEQAFFRNGKMLGNWTENDMANIDYIEVIKGPSGTLFGGHGRANYGGVVNRITKKPFDTWGGSVSLTSGSYAFNRLTADINTPLSKDGSLLGRVNTAYRKEKSFQDYGWAESFFVAPAFSYKASEKLTLTLEADLFKIKGTQRPYLSASGITSTDELDAISNVSFTTNEIIYDKQSSILAVDAVYKISDNWSSTTSYAYSYSLYAPDYTDVFINGNMAERSVGYARYDYDYTSVQQYFNGDFKVAGLRNRLLVGLDYLGERGIYAGGSAFYDTFDYHTIAPYITGQDFDTTIVAATPWKGVEISDRYSIYASNVLDVTSQLHVMASVRYEYFKTKSPSATMINANDSAYTFNQGAWTPKLGVVYEVVPSRVSVFGNYMGGTKNVNNFLRNDGSGNGVFQKAVAERATQWEVGIKSTLVDDRFSFMASYFDITVDNRLRSDLTNPLFSLQDGTQENKGVEVEFFANPVAGLNLMAGYANLEAKYTNGSDEGKHVAFTPKNTLNYWLSYAFQQGEVKGLGFGFGGNYRGDSYLTSENVVEIPAVHTLQATIFYEQANYRIAVKADNLTDEKYWGGFLNAQAPRIVRGSLTVKF